MTCDVQAPDGRRQESTGHAALYAVFIDFKASTWRLSLDAKFITKLMLTLAEMNVPTNMLDFFVAIQWNRMAVEDGTFKHPLFTQTIGLVQEGKLNPLLFFVLLKGLPIK